MASKLYQETQNNRLTTDLQMLKENPAQFLLERKLNIPKECQGNPQEAVNYLVQSGQVSQNSVNWAMQMANRMGVKF